MNITRITLYALYLPAALWIIGCSAPNPNDLIKGWKCLSAPGAYYVNNPLDKHLYHDYKTILDDSQDFIKKLELSYGFSASDISFDILAERERIVFDWCRQRRIPVAFVLAGGYIGSELNEAGFVDLHRLTLSSAARMNQLIL
jgi:hypothetical protein